MCDYHQDEPGNRESIVDRSNDAGARLSRALVYPRRNGAKGEYFRERTS